MKLHQHPEHRDPRNGTAQCIQIHPFLWPWVRQLGVPHHCMGPSGQIVVFEGLLEVTGTALQARAWASPTEILHMMATIMTATTADRPPALKDLVPNQRPGQCFCSRSFMILPIRMAQLGTVELDATTRHGDWEANHLKSRRHSSAAGPSAEPPPSSHG